MRIVDVNELYSPTGGGVRTYVERKLAVMASLGHEQIVIAPGREDRVEERPGGGRIYFVKAPTIPVDRNYGLFWDAAPVHALLDRLQPDVVENNSPWRSAAIVAEWQGDALKAWFWHNDNVEAYPKRWFARVASGPAIERAFAWYDAYVNRRLAAFDTVVTNGPVLFERFRRRGVRVDASMELGIERGWFSPDLRDEELRRAMLAQCDLPADAHLLIGIGRHHPEKRWSTVIDAVQRAGAGLPVGLIILGQGVETAKLERHVGDNPHIRLFRPVYDRRRLAELMASADAFIHGCAAETFGLVAGEAVASGLPMIVPDEGGAAAIADPHARETYPAGDAYAAAAAIERLFAREPMVLCRSALAAAGRVRSDVDHARELVAHYAACIATKRGDQPALARSA